MGYRRERRTFKLTFTDPELKGLEVVALSCPTGVYLEMSELAHIDVSKGLSLETLNKVRTLYSRFADALISWNLEDNNGPTPTTVEGLLSHDIEFIKFIIISWMNTVGGVDAPLDQPSNDGNLFPEESIPVETLYPNPLS